MKKLLLLLISINLLMLNLAKSQCIPTCSNYVGSTVAFNMLPIAGHNSVTLSDEELSSPINIGFNFDFFCSTKTQFLISSNGFITFDLSATDANYAAYNLPDASSDVLDLIALYWMDFDPALGGAITYTTLGTAPNRQCVVTFTDINLYADPGFINTMQLILYETTNEIEIQTNYITNDGSLGSQGIENGDGSSGFAIPNSNLNLLNLTGVGYRFSLPGTPTAPSSILGATTSICQGAAPGTYSVNQITGATYNWSLPSGWTGSSTTNVITPGAAGTSGTITVTASYPVCGTSIPIELPVVITPAPVVALSIGAPVICSGNTVNISVSGASTYTLDPGGISGSSSFVVSPGANTVYTLSGTNAAGCVSSNHPSGMITVNQTPTVSINSGSICAGHSFTLTANGADSYSYSVAFPVVTQQTAGTYTYSVVGTNTNGCSGNAAVSTLIVAANPTVSASAAGNRLTICRGENVSLSAQGADTYVWENGPSTGSYTVSPNFTTIYNVTGTNTDGCLKTTSITITVQECTGIAEHDKTASALMVYPNPSEGSFTINAKEAATVEIYDIQGKLVFKQNIEQGNSTLSIDQQAAGQYLLRAVSEKQVQSVILLKQ